MVEHLIPQMPLHLDGGAEEGNTPQKPAYYHAQDDADHGHTDPIQQEIQIKAVGNSVHFHKAVVHAVKHHAVQLRDLQLQTVHQHQREQAEDQPAGVPQVVAVDVFSEYQNKISFPRKNTHRARITL